MNLAGVEVVLNMRRKMEQIEAEVNELLEFVQTEFFSGPGGGVRAKRREPGPGRRRTKIVKIERSR